MSNTSNHSIRNKFDNQRGIAVFLALIMLLVMSLMAISISFISNTDFQTMSSFKRGQESFLAAERCVQEARRLIEAEGIGTLLFKQSFNTLDEIRIELDFDNKEGNGPVCRSGSRIADGEDPDPVFDLPQNVRSIERVVRNTSLPDSGSGGAKAIPITFTVIGKDSQDRDKDDEDDNINTGTQIAVGIETFTGGGSSNVY